MDNGDKLDSLSHSNIEMLQETQIFTMYFNVGS